MDINEKMGKLEMQQAVTDTKLGLLTDKVSQLVEELKIQNSQQPKIAVLKQQVTSIEAWQAIKDFRDEEMARDIRSIKEERIAEKAKIGVFNWLASHPVAFLAIVAIIAMTLDKLKIAQLL